MRNKEGSRTGGTHAGTAVLIYDGECPICRGAVDRVRRRAPPGAFEFLSCHDESLSRRFPEVDRAACLSAMHLVLPDGRVRAGADALPEILSRLPRWRIAAPLFRLPGARLLARPLYRWFAARRHRISRLTGAGEK